MKARHAGALSAAGCMLTDLEATMKIPTIASALCVSAILPAAPARASSCESLAALALKDTTITMAQLVPAGQFSLPGERQGRGPNPYKDLSEFCRVAATLKPTSDSDIKVEVWLPASNWNGKFQAVGNGGWAGVISYSAMAEAVRAGYASASTDTGHVGGRGTFALDHPEKLIDFAWRSEHEMTVAAKAVVAGVLWPRTQAVILERLLDRRPARPEGSAEISRRLQRHHRRSARQSDRYFVVDCRRGVEGSGQLHSAEQVSDHSPGRGRVLRSAGWPQGRPDRRSDEVQIRSEGAALQRRGRSRLVPDRLRR